MTMKNSAKLSCFFLSFLFFSSITPLENTQTVTTTIQSYLQYLEPANPLVPRIVGIPNIIVDGAALFFTDNNSKKASPYFFSVFQFIVQADNLLFSGLTLKTFSNAMMLNSTTYSFNFINYIIPDPKDQSVPINICKGICSFGLPLIAHYNNPSLFALNTYSNFFDIMYENPVVIPPCLTAFYYKEFNPDSLIEKISHIFDAKQTMFLIAVMLACFNIKLKSNKILTNPAYWLSISIAHLLFNDYKFITIENRNGRYSSNAVLCQKARSFFSIEDPGSYKYKALHYACNNVIPISAVLISAVFPI